MGGLLATTPSLPRPLRPGHQPLPVQTAGVGSALSPRPFSPGRSLCGPPLSASEQHCGARGARGLLAPSCGPWHRARQEVVEGAAARANPPDTRGPALLLGLCPRGHPPQGARRGWVPSVPRATPTGPSPVLSSCYSSERRPSAWAGPAAPAAPDRVCPVPAVDPAPAAASRGPGLQWAAAETEWTLPTPPRSHRPPPRPARRRPAQVSSLQKKPVPFLGDIKADSLAQSATSSCPVCGPRKLAATADTREGVPGRAWGAQTAPRGGSRQASGTWVPPLPVPTGERRARAGAAPFLCPGKALEEESE